MFGTSSSTIVDLESVLSILLMDSLGEAVNGRNGGETVPLDKDIGSSVNE